jgi:pyruvate dehydrogenase E1 component beta subunit
METAFDYLDAPIKRVSTAETPIPYAKNLEAMALPDVDKIVAAVKEVCYL